MARWSVHFAVLDRARHLGAESLRQSGAPPFPPAAARLVAAARDDASRLAAWEVATAMLLRRALRNGSAHTPDSVRHRSVSDQLIPSHDWEARRRATSARMGWASNLAAHLRRIEPALRHGLVALDAAVAAGEIALNGDRLVFPRLRATPVDPAVDQSRRALFDAVGQAQLPEVIIAVDRMTEFSAMLVDGRGVRSLDRAAIYAALIVSGVLRARGSTA